MIIGLENDNVDQQGDKTRHQTDNNGRGVYENMDTTHAAGIHCKFSRLFRNILDKVSFS